MKITTMTITMMMVALVMVTNAAYAQVPAMTPPTPAPVVPATATAASAAALKVEQDVQKAEKDRFDAMIKVDAGALDKLLGAELSYTHSNAQVQDKAGFISDIRGRNIRYVSIEPSDVHVVVLGTTAVVTGGAAIHVIENGDDLTIKVRYTDVHINRRGEWQMVAWQATKLPQ